MLEQARRDDDEMTKNLNEITESLKPNARTTVPEMLEGLASIYRERNASFGDNYLRYGRMLLALFPMGLELRTEGDFGRFALFVLMQTKMSRTAEHLPGGHHPDSLDDLAVYTQMLREFSEGAS